MKRENLKSVGRNLARIMSLGLLVGVGSCNTDVVNPGPIDASFLNDSDSQAAITNGAGRALADFQNWIGYTSAAIAREVHPSGSTGSFGITPEQQRGELNDDEVNTQWSNGHRARFLAADGIERILGLDAADRDGANLAKLYLYAGYTSRLLGDMMCESIIDGGNPASSDVHLNAAIGYFDLAASTGSGDLAIAAVAGRASVHVSLRNWGAAVADAATIPAGFSWELPFFDIGDDTQSNRIFVAGKATPYKAHTTLFTWVETYGLEATTMPAGDPRMPWTISGENGDASTACCGVIAFNPQTKFDADDSGIEMSSWEEMQLIMAESEIMTGGAAGLVSGMAKINALRAAAGMAAEVAADQAAAMTWLKREHAIEQWLEGRRLPAMRRWDADGTPGALQPLEEVGDGDTMTGSHLLTRDFCFPVSESEQQTNPFYR
jgi:hypothetical protein